MRGKRWVLLGEGRVSTEFEQTVSHIQTFVTSIVKKNHRTEVADTLRLFYTFIYASLN